AGTPALAESVGHRPTRPPPRDSGRRRMADRRRRGYTWEFFEQSSPAAERRSGPFIFLVTWRRWGSRNGPRCSHARARDSGDGLAEFPPPTSGPAIAGRVSITGAAAGAASSQSARADDAARCTRNRGRSAFDRRFLCPRLI